MWIVARTKPNQERIAQVNLKRQAVESYLPLFSDGGKLGPLFPGYIFANIDGRWSHLNSTYGISKVISFGERPASLADSIIDDLRARERDGLVILPTIPTPTFARGDKVRIVDGPFSGFQGVYDGMDKAARESVLLDLLGRKTRVLVAGTLAAA